MVTRYSVHRGWRGWLGLALLLAPMLVLQGCAHPGAAAAGADADAASASDVNTDVRKRAHIRLELAASYLQSGRANVALDEARQAVTIDPTYADAWHLRGLAYMALKDLSKAQSDLERARDLKPGDPDILHNLGWLRCEQKDYDAADALFKQALATPGYAQRVKTQTAQGVCYERAGHLKLAHETLLHAYEFDARNPVVGYHLASVIFAQGDAERARFYIRRVNNGEFSDAASLWLGIKVERALKDTQAMGQLAEQLNKRYPSSKEALALGRGAFDE